MKTLLLFLISIFSITSFASDQSYMCYSFRDHTHGYQYIRMVYFGGDLTYSFALLHPKDEKNFNINRVGKIEKMNRIEQCRVLNDGDFDRCRLNPSTVVEGNKYSEFTGEGQLDWAVFGGFSGAKVKFLGDGTIYRASFMVCPPSRTVE